MGGRYARACIFGSRWDVGLLDTRSSVARRAASGPAAATILAARLLRVANWTESITRLRSTGKMRSETRQEAGATGLLIEGLITDRYTGGETLASMERGQRKAIRACFEYQHLQ